MVSIDIRSPQDVRREVNALKLINTSSSMSSWRRKRHAESTVIRINFSHQNRWSRTLQATDLLALLNGAPRLDQLSLDKVEVEGDFDPVIEAIQKQLFLTGLALFGSNLNGADFTALGNTLANLPHLEWVNFSPLRSTLGETQPTLSLLLPVLKKQKSCFRNIFAIGDVIAADDEQIQHFWSAVWAAPSLDDLTYSLMAWDAFRSEHIPLIGEAIRKSTSLRTLKIQVHPRACLMPLAEGLKNNSTLTSLTIQRSPVDGGTALVEMKQFLSVLETHNFTLKDLSVDGWNAIRDGRQILQSIEFYLGLNRCKRSRLIRDPNYSTTPEDWMEAISNRDDPSTIFYFMVKNPNICRYVPTDGNKSGNDINQSQEEKIAHAPSVENAASKDVIIRSPSQKANISVISDVNISVSAPLNVVSPDDSSVAPHRQRLRFPPASPSGTISHELQQLASAAARISSATANSPMSQQQSTVSQGGNRSNTGEEETNGIVDNPGLSMRSMAPLLSLMGVLNGAMYAAGYFMGVASAANNGSPG